jgi:hypothetical protein
MTEQLFDIPEAVWKQQKKIQKLRTKIKARTLQLGITMKSTPEGHIYTYKGVDYPSVTHHIQTLKDPGLMNWKMNKALEYIASQKTFLQTGIGNEALIQLLDQAKLAPQLEFEGAGDIGSNVHNVRQNWFSEWIDTGINPDPRTIASTDLFQTETISALRALEKFVKDTGYVPLATELLLADPKLKIGGMLDDIGLINGELVLLDIKTSNIGNKDSYYAQVYLYLYMFRKLYKMYPKKVFILHLSKTNGLYNLISLTDRVDRKRTIAWAKKVVEVSQGLDELRETKRGKGIEV